MRAYDAENRVFRRRKTPILLTDAQAMATKLFDHFGVRHVPVKRSKVGVRRIGAGRAGSWYWYSHNGRDAYISLGGGIADWVVCHEVAHHVATERQGRDAGHGRLFCGIYIEAVRVAISETYAKRLLNAMRAEGLNPKEYVSA